MKRPELYRLREIKSADLERVLKWRNSHRIRSVMFTDNIITMEEHIEWFKKVKRREHITSMIFEYNENPAGVVNFTGIDRIGRICSWGFYLGEDSLPPGTGLAMGYLGLEYAFDNLGVDKVYGEVLDSNTPSVFFHRKLGFVDKKYLPRHLFKSGKYEDVIFFILTKNAWDIIKNDIKNTIGFC